MKYFNVLLMTFLMVTMISCSKDDSVNDVVPEITLADLAGSWKATSSIFTNNSNPAESVDFIDKGGEIRYTMFKDGRIRTWIEFNDSAVDEWDSLAELQNGNKLVVTPMESDRPVDEMTFKLEDKKLTLTNENTLFDFTLSEGEEVSATSVSVFIPH